MEIVFNFFGPGVQRAAGCLDLQFMQDDASRAVCLLGAAVGAGKIRGVAWLARAAPVKFRDIEFGLQTWRFAQQALGHNSKAVYRAYAKYAEVTVPSLADWEKNWQQNPQCSAQPKLLLVNFRQLMAPTAEAN
jgi:hypothetical protein